MEQLIPFTTSGSLVDIVDKKVLIVLRDGRNLIGVLRSYDQFANLVLESAVERFHHPHYPIYGDRPVGMNLHVPGQAEQNVELIRGENVVLLGEIDLDMEDDVPLQAAQSAAEVAHIEDVIKQEKAKRKRTETTSGGVLRQLGFSASKDEGDAY